MKKKKNIFTLLFLYCLFGGFSQNFKILDSLKKAFYSRTEIDSTHFVTIKTICEIYLTSSDFDSVLVYGKKAIDLCDKTKNERYKIKFLSVVGVAYWNKADYNSAIKYYEEGLKLIEKTGFKSNLATLLNNIGLAYWDKSDFPKALDYFIRSYEIDRKKNDKAGMSSSLLNIGLVYSDMQDYKKALNYYFQSIKYCTEIGDEQSKAIALINIGQVYSNMKEFNKSLEYDYKALRVAEKYNDKKSIALINNNIGSIYSDKLDFKNAHYYFERAQENFEVSGDNNGLVLLLNNMGDLYIKEKKYKEAIPFYTRALKIEQEFGLLDDESSTRKGMANAFYLQNDFKNAYDNYVLFNILNDSIATLRNLGEINNMQTEMELRDRENELNIEKQKELAAKEAEKQRQIFFTYGAVLVLLIVGGFSVFVYRQKSVIEKQKHLVEEKQKEIMDSIRYAKRIQQSLIANEKYIQKTITRLKDKG